MLTSAICPIDSSSFFYHNHLWQYILLLLSDGFRITIVRLQSYLVYTKVSVLSVCNKLITRTNEKYRRGRSLMKFSGTEHKVMGWFPVTPGPRDVPPSSSWQGIMLGSGVSSQSMSHCSFLNTQMFGYVTRFAVHTGSATTRAYRHE